LGINTMIVGGDQSVAIPAWIAREFIGQAAASQLRPGRGRDTRRITTLPARFVVK